MMKTLITLGAAAVAVSAVPASAHRAHEYACTQHRHNNCVMHSTGHHAGYHDAGYHRAGYRAVGHHNYRVGYVFGPNYGYTAYNQLPHSYVTHYRLSPDNRYVYSNGYVYVVDPTTYAITRILNSI